MNLDRLHPALIAILGIGVLSVMDALIKAIGAELPLFEMIFLRFVFGVATAMAVWVITRPALPNREAIKINLFRGCLVTLTVSTFFYALRTLPLAEAIAFSFLSPLFLALFGALILGERIGRHTLGGLAIGFLGMVVMVGGQGFSGVNLHLPGAAAAIASAVTYAFSLVLLRQRAQQDALITIVLFQNIVPGTIIAVPAVMTWVPPSMGDLGLTALIGVMGVCGHLLMGAAFRRAEASRLAIAEYSALLYATVLGFVFFKEIPGLATLAGTALIVIGTLLAMRERGNPDVPPVDPAP
ncbi:MAG: transporter [Rhizobiales bacterium PAR1]|nr:MAG: transporter [Rhizobiales bacterium PAR1]